MAGIVPRKAVQELTRALGRRRAAWISPSARASSSSGRRASSSCPKLVEGQFPNYEQVIPEVIAPAPGRSASRRWRRFAGWPSSPTIGRARCDSTASAGQVRLSAQSQELGEAEETLPAEFAGDELTIGFNARYVLDALGPMDHPWTVVGLKRRPQSRRFARCGGQERRAG